MRDAAPVSFAPIAPARWLGWRPCMPDLRNGRMARAT
jgi:hypothetical protein